jgi:hypothetical protein
MSDNYILIKYYYKWYSQGSEENGSDYWLMRFDDDNFFIDYSSLMEKIRVKIKEIIALRYNYELVSIEDHTFIM